MTTSAPASANERSPGTAVGARGPSFWARARFKVETSLRNLTRPYLNTFAFFEADLAHMPISMPETELRPRVFCGPSDEEAYRLLVPMGVAANDLKQRIRRGDLVSIGFVGDEPVAYTWMTFQHVEVKELGLKLRLGPGEASQYDTFVAPKWRGRGFQYPLNVPVLRYAQEHGFTRTLAWVHVLNTRSFKNQVRSGKRVVQRVVALRLPGVKRTWVWRMPGELRVRLTPITPDNQLK